MVVVFYAACVVVTIVAHRRLLCANILFSFNIDGCFLFELDFGSHWIGWFGSVWFRTGRHRIEFEFEFDRECRGLHAHRAIQSVIYVFI